MPHISAHTTERVELPPIFAAVATNREQTFGNVISRERAWWMRCKVGGLRVDR